MGAGKTRVSWSESISVPEQYWGEIPEDFKYVEEREGYVIGTHTGWLGTTLVVVCSDARIREVSMNSVKIIDNEDSTLVKK